MITRKRGAAALMAAIYYCFIVWSCGPGSEMATTRSSVVSENAGSTAVSPRSSPVVPLDTIGATDAVGDAGQGPGTTGKASVSSDGEAIYEYPIWTPPGRAGIQPNLKLVYHSRAGNGLLGVGWSLEGLPQITMCPDPRSTQLAPLCFEGSRLIGIGNNEYRTEVDSFTRIIDQGNHTFQILTKDGLVMNFAPVKKALSLTSMSDAFGNQLTVQYLVPSPSGGNMDQDGPVEIDYTSTAGSTDAGPPATRSVKFTYETRPDFIETFVGGPASPGWDLMTQRISKIEAWGPSPAATGLLRRYKLGYGSGAGNRSVLGSVTECDGSGVCLEPTRFSGNGTSLPVFEDINTGIAGSAIDSMTAGDINGDGRDDILYHVRGTGGAAGQWYYQLSGLGANGAPFAPPVAVALPDRCPKNFGASLSPAPIDCINQLALVDLDGDGLADLVESRVWGTSGVFGPQLVSVSMNAYLSHSVPPAFNTSAADYSYTGNAPAQAPLGSFVSVGDVTADGRPDLVLNSPTDMLIAINTTTSPGHLSFTNSVAKHPANANGANGAGYYSYAGQMVDLYGNGVSTFLSPSCSTTVFGTGEGNANCIYTGPVPVPPPSFLPDAASGTPWDLGVHLAAGLVAGDYFVVPLADIFLDVNGDGLSDLIRIEQDNGKMRVLTNARYPAPADPYGVDFVSSGTTTNHLPSIPDPTTNRLRVADLDGDGRQDLVLLGSGDLNTLTTTGTMANVSVVLTHDFSIWQVVTTAEQPIPVGSNPTASEMLDFDGDGLMDFVSVQGGTLHLYRRTGYPADLLTNVIDPVGLQTSIFYAPVARDYTTPGVYQAPHACDVTISCFPTIELTRGLWVVSGIQTGHRNWTYNYYDGRYDVQKRGWLGFESQTVTDAQTGESTTTTYDNSTKLNDLYPLAKRPRTVASIAHSADTGVNRIKTIVYSYAVSATANNGVYTVLPSAREISDDEWVGTPTSSAGIRHLYETYSYDSYGNPASTTATTGDGYQQTTTWQYDPPVLTVNGAPAWLVRLLNRVQVTSAVPAGSVPTGTPTWTTRTTEVHCNQTTGVVEYTKVEPGTADATVYKRTDYGYNANGLLHTVTDSDLLSANSQTTTIQYDAIDGTFPASVVNNAGEYIGLGYHSGLGVLAIREDENGVGARQIFDGFGRSKAVITSDQCFVADAGTPPAIGSCTAPAKQWSYQTTFYAGTSPPQPSGYIVTQVEAEGGSNSRTTQSTYDNHGREIASQSVDFSGALVGTTKTYDVLGRLFQETAPAAVGTVGPMTTFAYDILNRLTSVQHPDGTVATTQYVGLTSTTADEKGNQKSRTVDQLGRVTQTIETTETNRQLATHFSYGPFSLPASILDAYAHQTTFSYDAKGRRLSVVDPDTGNNSFTYTPFDEVQTSTNANDTTTFYRDPVGRPLRIVNTKDGETDFHWGTVADVTTTPADGVNAIGKLVSSTSPDQVKTLQHYDPIGRVQDQKWTVLGQDYTYAYNYDSIGRLDSTVYPSVPGRTNLAVKYGYTPQGDLQTLSNALTGAHYWTVQSRNPSGQLTGELFGNGVTSQRRYDSRNFLRFVSTKSGATPIQSLAYEWEANGNLAHRHDLNPANATTEDFGYDGLNRLTSWTVFQNCGQSATLQYGYDDIGNLTSRNLLAGGSIALGTSGILGYGQAAGPHAVTSSPEGAYTYDAVGNQLTAPNRTVAYTAFNLPKRIYDTNHANDVSFQYDAGRHRALKQNANGDKTVSVGELLEKRTIGGVTTDVFRVGEPSGIVAQVEWSESAMAESVVYLHDDHLGSVESVTNAVGARVGQPIKYDPFGSRRAASNLGQNLSGAPQADVQDGFTGHRHDDEFGLIHMRGRAFDPTAGRFLSADVVVQFPTIGQSWNRYSYVRNNPLSARDPSGFDETDGGELVAYYNGGGDFSSSADWAGSFGGGFEGGVSSGGWSVTAAPSNVGIVPAGVAGASSGNQGATPTDSNLFSGQSAIAGTASSQSPRGSLLSVDSAVAFGSSFMKNAEVASKTALLLAPIMAAVSAPVAAAIGAVAIGYAVYSVARMGYELYNHEDLWTGQPLSAVDEAGRLGGLVGGLAGGYGGFKAAGSAGGLGDLTPAEVKGIQSVVDEAGRPLEVVGSAAKSVRRGVGTDLPIGKGPGTRSDIDFLVPPGSAPYFQGFEDQLPGLDPRSGIIPGMHNPYMGPAIRFEPGAQPLFVPEATP